MEFLCNKNHQGNESKVTTVTMDPLLEQAPTAAGSRVRMRSQRLGPTAPLSPQHRPPGWAQQGQPQGWQPLFVLLFLLWESKFPPVCCFQQGRTRCRNRLEAPKEPKPPEFPMILLPPGWTSSSPWDSPPKARLAPPGCRAGTTLGTQAETFHRVFHFHAHFHPGGPRVKIKSFKNSCDPECHKGK